MIRRAFFAKAASRTSCRDFARSPNRLDRSSASADVLGLANPLRAIVGRAFAYMRVKDCGAARATGFSPRRRAMPAMTISAFTFIGCDQTEYEDDGFYCH